MGGRIKAHLVRHGVNVVMTREENKTVALAERAQIANNAKADLFVSLHSNAAGSSGWNSASGLCVYTYGTGADKPRNILANKLLDRFGAAGIKLFGSKLYHSAFTVLANTAMPACLIEYSFHDNQSDVTNLRSNTWRQLAAEATARGVCDYLGIEYQEAPAGTDAYQEALNKLVTAGWGDILVSMSEKV